MSAHNDLTGLIATMALKDRIKEAMDGADNGAGITPAELARRCKVSPSSVTLWLNGSTKSLKGATVSRLEAATGYSGNWIVTGRGEKLVSKKRHEPEDDAPAAVNRSPFSIQAQQVATLFDYLPDDFRVRTVVAIECMEVINRKLKECETTSPAPVPSVN